MVTKMLREVAKAMVVREAACLLCVKRSKLITDWELLFQPPEGIDAQDIERFQL